MLPDRPPRHDVFISYVRDNAAQVERLASDLERSGVSVWLDRASLVAGERWAEAIVAAIRSGAFFLPCFSAEYQRRERTYMAEELHVARAVLAERTVDRPWCIPLLLDATSAADVGLAADPLLGALHAVAMWPDWADGLRRVLQTVSPERAFGSCRNALPARAAAPLSAAPLLALDFGTSNSLMAYRNDASQWVPIRTLDGRTAFPSVVTFSEAWDYWVGAEAVEAAQRLPERCVRHIKRVLARGGQVHLGHKVFDAVTLASLVIRHMKDCAERQLGVRVEQVVAAAPVAHGRHQRAALRQACERAGLTVTRSIGESTAAGLLAARWAAQSGSTEDDALVLVVDIGGGTTDLTLLELARSDDDWQFETLETRGDKELGGMDYDESYQQFLFRRYIEPLVRHGMPWSDRDERRLALLATQAKHSLAGQAACTVTLTDVELQPGEPDGRLQMHVTRGDLETAGAHLDKRLLPLFEPLDRLAKTYARSAQPLAAVLLAGQGAKNWSVSTLIRRRYPKVPLITEYQDNAVAQGLALQGEVLDGRRKDYLLLDVTNLTLGVFCASVDETDGLKSKDRVLQFELRSDAPGEWATLVPTGTSIPWRSQTDAAASGPGNLRVKFGEWSGSPVSATELAIVSCELPAGPQLLRIVVELDAGYKLHLSVHDAKRSAPLGSLTIAY